MRWYSRLYVGEKAKKKRYAIIHSVREGTFMPGAYVITPPQNGHNVLDIYPAAMLLLPPYRDQDLLILGIAASYWEALDLTRDIVDEMYRETGGFDLAKFVEEQ